MGIKQHHQLSNWLMHDDQKELFDILFAFVLNLVFVVVITGLLWPLGRAALAFRLANGYGCLWLIVYLTFLLLYRVHGYFQVNDYDRANAFVISNLFASCFLQVAWSAFAAFSVHSFATGASGWMQVILFLVGIVSCFVAFFAVSSFYHGHIYKLISLPVALVSFVVFSLWPIGGRVLYG